MAKNRKNQPAAVRFGPILKALLFCAALGGAGVGYVELKNQIHELSLQIQRKEKARAKMREDNEKLAKQLAALRSPPFLHARVREWNLELGPPQPAQVVRLPEPVPPEPPAPGATGGTLQLAADAAARQRMVR